VNRFTIDDLRLGSFVNRREFLRVIKCSMESTAALQVQSSIVNRQSKGVSLRHGMLDGINRRPAGSIVNRKS